MVKFLTRAGKHTGRYLALATLTATLVACGGGSGDTDMTDLDGPDGDSDGDGILNKDDIDNQDLDGDLIANIDDDDDDGDGIIDAELDPQTGDRLDKFIDRDLDGLDDESGLREGPANYAQVTEDMPCGSEPGTDAYSANAAWNDNCLVRRSINIGEGQWADSLYAVAIQRVIFCALDESPGGTVVDFADGEYGPQTESFLKTFQASTPGPVADDGIVGGDTWAKLQDAIELLQEGQQQENGSSTVQDTYGFATGRCANQPLFYQTMVFLGVNDGYEGRGWRLAKNPPNAAQSVPFSIDQPFGRL